MDNLEKYIRNHRDEFDTDEPGVKVWEGLKQSLDQSEPGSKTTSWVWKVAAAILLLTTTYLAVDRWQLQQDGVIALNEATDNEFVSAEQYYLQEIGNLQAELAAYPYQEFIDQDFMAELETLDSLYVQLKREFSEPQDNVRIAEALIQNLRIRMSILNQQLVIIEKIKRKNINDDVEI